MFLKKIRKQENLTQKNVAEHVGITESFYCLIENGLRRPSPDTAKRIAKALNFKKYGYDWTKFYSSNEQDEVKNDSQSISDSQY